MGEIMTFFDMPGFERFKEKETREWDWQLSDLEAIPKNGLKVFSCFACGGGSTMGYKLAGCEVLGCVEIDKKMNEIYKKNHNPKHSFLMDIRDFNKIPDSELPEELFHLDILDGSPPCTTFSMAGERADTWGKEKKFREGQKAQTLDDLSFVFIETVNKLKPKVVVMENVEGLLLGDAWSYVQRIYSDFHNIGYDLKHWLVKGERMGVPQGRHRVIFIAVKKERNFDLSSFDMTFNYKPIPFKIVKSPKGIELDKDSPTYKLLKQARPTDTDLSDVSLRVEGKESRFSSKLLFDHKICPTIRAGAPDYYRFGECTRITNEELIRISSFPKDYDFGSDKVGNVCYVVGMSVPPVMIKRVVEKLLKKRDQIF